MSASGATPRPGGDVTILGQLRLAQKRFPILQVIALGVVFAYGGATLNGLFSWISIKTILILGSLVALAAAGQTLLILMGGFDLSVSGLIAAGETILVLPSKLHVAFGVALLLIVLFAAVLGGCAGHVCHRLRINPLLITLASGAIALGLAGVAAGPSEFNASAGVPAWVTGLTSPVKDTFGINIPPLVAITIVVTIAMGLFLHRTVAGRRLFATGASIRAAEYSFVNTRRIWTGAFAFSAVVSALVGVVLGGFTGSIDPSVGDPYLFLGVAAVFVGGTVFGGPGDFTRTLIGALFLEVLTTVLVGHGFDTGGQQILNGVILVIAVTVYGRGSRMRDRI